MDGVTECAFVTRAFYRGKAVDQLQMHLRGGMGFSATSLTQHVKLAGYQNSAGRPTSLGLVHASDTAQSLSDSDISCLRPLPGASARAAPRPPAY